MKNQIYMQGIGRLSNEQIHKIGEGDLQAISRYLGTKQFFHGDKPTSVRH